jgi:hypothetical protein
MPEFAVGVATIASGVTAVVTLIITLIDRRKRPPQKIDEQK